MKKRVMSLFLCLALVLGLWPGKVWAADPAPLTTAGGLTISGGVSGQVDGDYYLSTTAGGAKDCTIIIQGNGPYTLSGSDPDAVVLYYGEGDLNLTFNNVCIEQTSMTTIYPPIQVGGEGEDQDKNVNITLIGKNTLASEENNRNPAILGGPQTTINFMAESTGTLVAKGGQFSAAIGGYHDPSGNHVKLKRVNIYGGNIQTIPGFNFGNVTGNDNIGHILAEFNGELTGIGGATLNAKPTELSFENVTDEGVIISELQIIDGSLSTYNYGANTTTTANGKVYLWLPVGAKVIGATINGQPYVGEVASGGIGTFGIPAMTVSHYNGETKAFSDLTSALTFAKENNNSSIKLLKSVDSNLSSDIVLDRILEIDLNGFNLNLGAYGLNVLDIAEFILLDSSPTARSAPGVLTSNKDTITVDGRFTGKGGKVMSTSDSSYGLKLGTDPNVSLQGGTYGKISLQGSKTANDLLGHGYRFYTGDSPNGTSPNGNTQTISETVTVGPCDWTNAIAYDSTTKTYTVNNGDGLRWIVGASYYAIEEDTFEGDPAVPLLGSSQNNTFEGYTVKLGSDIDLSEMEWNSISLFNGTFDGAGHTIHNMNIGSDKVNGGLFNTLGSDAKVRNLTVNGNIDIITKIYDRNIAGAIATEVNATTGSGREAVIENCISDVNVKISGDETADFTVAAGLVGYVRATGDKKVSIENCYVMGTVSNTSNAYQGSFTGDLVGYIELEFENNLTIKNCYTSDTVNDLIHVKEGTPQPLMNSVGAYDLQGNLTPAAGKSLEYGSALNKAVMYWVNRQAENIGNFVTWTLDVLPALTTEYAQNGPHTYSEWVKGAGETYTRMDLSTGLTESAESLILTGSGEALPFTTLEEALTQAENYSACTVKLLNNVETEKIITLSEGNFSIDLNGHEWKCFDLEGLGSFGCIILEDTGDLTLKDSKSGGRLTSTTSLPVLYATGKLTIEGGTYISDTGFGDLIGVAGTKGVSILSGDFQGPVHFDSCKEAKISGGTFNNVFVTNDSDDTTLYSTVGELLADGYAYKNTSGGTWATDLVNNTLSDVSVEVAPVKITKQPENITATYGYTGPIVLNIEAKTVPEDSGKAITYQWYLDYGKLDGKTQSSLSLAPGLATGEYKYSCVVTCDDCPVSSQKVIVKIDKMAGSIVNEETDGYNLTQTYTGVGIEPLPENFEMNGEQLPTFTWYEGQNPDGSVEGLTLKIPNIEPVNAGLYTLKAEFPEGSNVTAAEATFKVTIEKATPEMGTVAYNGPALFTSTKSDNIVLERSDLSLDGTLALKGDTKLIAGPHDYEWTFTPTDSVNYKTISGKVSLSAIQDTVDSISIGTSTPSKKDYVYGDVFDMTGLVVTATYISGVKADVTALAKADTLKVGDTKVVLAYTEGGISKICEVTGITVDKKQLELAGISWETAQTFTFNGSEQELSLNGTIPEGVAVTKAGEKGILAGAYEAIANFFLAEGYSSDNYQLLGENEIKQSWAIDKANTPDIQELVNNHVWAETLRDHQIDVASLLPENRGQTQYEVMSGTYLGLENVNVLPTGVLAYKTLNTGQATSDTLQVKVIMQNYNDVTLSFKVNLVDKIEVSISGLKALENRVYDGKVVSNADFGTPAFAPNTYNGKDLTYTYYSGNGVSGTPLAMAPKEAGTYTVRVSISDANPSFIGYKDLTFNIDKAVIRPTAVNKTMSVGQGLPTLSVAYIGMAEGDAADSIFKTLSTAKVETDGKTVGTFDITVIAPALREVAALNYSVGAPVKGTLTVKAVTSGGGSADRDKSEVKNSTNLNSGSNGSANPSTAKNSSSDKPNVVQIGRGDAMVGALVSVSGSTAKISLTAEQAKEISTLSGKGEGVSIDVSGQNVSEVVLSTEVIEAVSTSPLEINLENASISLDSNALAAVKGKGDVKVSVQPISPSELSETQKTVLGKELEAALVVDVNIYVNESITSTFGNGKINISIPYALKPNEAPESITVWFVKDDGTIEPKNGIYKDGKVSFVTEHLSRYVVVSFPFADVSESAWYYNSVAYTYTNGLFTGTSKSTFQPNEKMTRQMIWTVLARLDGKNPSGVAEAKAWVMENGISDGSNPNQVITREQMAAILYRYASYKEMDIKAGEDVNILSYSDGSKMSEYAIPALQWACGSGLIQGNGNKLMPTGSATRAQVAAVLQRFIKNQN